jgi:hypothetical protein
MDYNREGPSANLKAQIEQKDSTIHAMLIQASQKVQDTVFVRTDTIIMKNFRAKQ